MACAAIASAAGIPRLKSRGPIEAHGERERLILEGAPIPRLKSRGPIEAIVEDPSAPQGSGIPRLKSRGPIEAAWTYAYPAQARRFRG